MKSQDIFNGNYEKDFTEALSDHMWGRDFFVTAKTGVQVALGAREIDGVYIDGDRLIETYKDGDFDDKQIGENISEVTGFMSAMTSSLGKDHVKMLLVPSKCTIYREDVPSYVPMSRRADTLAEELRQSLAEQLMQTEPSGPEEEDVEEEEDSTEEEEDFSDTDSDEDIDFDFDEGDPEAEETGDEDEDPDEPEESEEEEGDSQEGTEPTALAMDENTAREAAAGMVMDLRPVLNDHKNEPIYYLTDHHWTSLGALYAYEALMGSANKKLTEMKTVSSDFLGTDYNRIHYYKNKDEIRQYIIPEADTAGIEINDSGDVTKRDSIYDTKALEGADKYNYFFSGNYSQVTVNTGTKNGKTLLIVKDSYSNSLVPFLCRDYEKIIMVDLRYVNASIYDYLPEDKKPDDVWIIYNEEKFMQDTHQGYLK